MQVLAVQELEGPDSHTRRGLLGNLRTRIPPTLREFAICLAGSKSINYARGQPSAIASGFGRPRGLWGPGLGTIQKIGRSVDEKIQHIRGRMSAKMAWLVL